MSERKTAEIKFRCTPSFKAGVQAAADAAGESLTEYVEQSVWARQNQAIDGNALIGNAIAQLREIGAGDSAAVAELECISTNTEDAAPSEGSASDEYAAAVAFVGHTAQREVVISNLTCDRACKPWEFCRCKA